MKKINIGDKIEKNGIVYKIIDRTDKKYLAEIYDKGFLYMIECGRFIIAKGYGPERETLTPNSLFGVRDTDCCVLIKNKDIAIKKFNKK